MQPEDRKVPSPLVLQTQTTGPAVAPPQSPLTIIELAEDMINRLDTPDQLRVHATSKELKDIVDLTSSIQRQLWKQPMPVKTGQNPHFCKLTDAQSAIRFSDGLSIPDTIKVRRQEELKD
jgi:pyruvate formate-lyase activating enzyme-like uncharacterized protein